MYPWGEGPILPELASDPCRASDSEDPWKGNRREVGWGWVTLSPLHLGSRLGREHKGNSQEGIKEVRAGPVCLLIMWEDFG